jgi:peptide chain release factor 1
MFDKLEAARARYDEVEALMGDPATLASGHARLTELAQERAKLEPTIRAYENYRKAKADLASAQEMLQGEQDPDLRAMADEEIAHQVALLAKLEEELTRILVPKDPRDDKNVFVEIRAGAGGDEAGLFAADLLRMYLRYAEDRRWKSEILSTNESGIGGFKEVIFEVKGNGAFSRLKYESGVHRVQRVPATEASGRIHTSTVTVAVLAEVDDIDVQINERDLKIDVYRSQGAGGQSVNTTDSAVRITHLPTGLVVAVQDERKQLQNRIKAMNILRARLYEMELEKVRSEQEADRRGQVGTGERSEKIRTYNFPQNRVTDHRVGLTIYNLPGVLDGALDPFIDELSIQDQAGKLGEGSADDE